MGSVYNFTMQKTDDLDYIIKCEDYDRYIKDHKANVYHAYEELFKNKSWIDRLPDEIDKDEWEDALVGLEEEIKVHDDSKYSDEEFEPYRRHFDKTLQEELFDKTHEEEAKVFEDEYERAWKHHYLLNPHHPNFWNYTDMVNGQLEPLTEPRKGGPRDMNMISIMHMICDWSGMSIKFRNKISPVSWYNTSAKEERGCMSEKTRHTLYLILSMMFPDEEVIE